VHRILAVLALVAAWSVAGTEAVAQKAPDAGKKAPAATDTPSAKGEDGKRTGVVRTKRRPVRRATRHRHRAGHRRRAAHRGPRYIWVYRAHSFGYRPRYFCARRDLGGYFARGRRDDCRCTAGHRHHHLWY
jgi:hypothetical protein